MLKATAVPQNGATIIVATATDAGGNTSEFSAAVPVAQPLLAAGGETSRGSRDKSQELNQAKLQPIVDAAIERLGGLGFSRDQFAHIQVAIADLPGAVLGLTAGSTVTIDSNAAGYGWFVDSTPLEDSEFNPQSAIGNQQSLDLLTAVMHELGHAAGLEDVHDAATADDLMYPWLEAGVRKTSFEAALADKVFAEF